MNRRQFTKSLAAAFAAPALPLPALGAPASAGIPNAARFWAIYMTRLHGDVTPGMLTQMTGIDPIETRAIRAKLLADKVISPTGFIRKGFASQTALQSDVEPRTRLKKLVDDVLEDGAQAEPDETQAEPAELTDEPLPRTDSETSDIS